MLIRNKKIPQSAMRSAEFLFFRRVLNGFYLDKVGIARNTVGCTAGYNYFIARLKPKLCLGNALCGIEKHLDRGITLAKNRLNAPRKRKAAKGLSSVVFTSVLAMQ